MMSTPYWLCLFAFIDVRGVDLLTMGSYFPSHPCVQWRAQSFFYPSVCWMRWCTSPLRTIITQNRVQADTIQMAFYQLHMFTFSVPALPLITETPAHMGNFQRSLSKKVFEPLLCFYSENLAPPSQFFTSVYQDTDPALAVNITD